MQSVFAQHIQYLIGHVRNDSRDAQLHRALDIMVGIYRPDVYLDSVLPARFHNLLIDRSELRMDNVRVIAPYEGNRFFRQSGENSMDESSWCKGKSLSRGIKGAQCLGVP